MLTLISHATIPITTIRKNNKMLETLGLALPPTKDPPKKKRKICAQKTPVKTLPVPKKKQLAPPVSNNDGEVLWLHYSLVTNLSTMKSLTSLH